MRILHVGHLSPHVHRVMRMFRRFAPEVSQEHVMSREVPVGGYDRVILHHVNTTWPLISMYSGVPVVGWIWNSLWLNDPGVETVKEEMRRCCLLVGPEGFDPDLGVRYYGHRPLVDEAVFRVQANGSWRRMFFVARGWQDPANLYWSREVAEALKGIEDVAIATGFASPVEFAELLQGTRVVIATRADQGPAYTVVEACMCGAVPVVSDTPEIRRHFVEDGAWVGARGCVQSVESIQNACLEVMGIADREREVERNLMKFESWTMGSQGPGLVEALLGA